MGSKKIKLWLIILEVLAIASIFFIVYYLQRKMENANHPDIAATNIDQTEVFNQSNASIVTEKTEEEKEAFLPAKFLLSIPFQPQAPYADWSQPYEDACEEAAIIIVEHYWQNKLLSKEEMKSEIDASVAWQKQNWGGHHDLPADQILKLTKDYFGLDGKVIRGYLLDDLKKIIHSGEPIIAPTAGRRLGNPNFRGAGPEYHNIVIIGYNDSQGIFITNDPGTRNGKSYIYKYETVLSAISGPNENMEKAVVVLGE